MWSLRIGNDRIGALLHGTDDHTVWMEFDLTGKELGRWPIQDRLISDFTATGSLYSWNPGGIAVFDHEKSGWNPASAMPDGRLLGNDGNALVFWIGFQPAALGRARPLKPRIPIL